MFGGRAFYTASHSPGRLVIDGVQPGDQATYTCRVDFKLAPTTISLVNLTVQSECAIVTIVCNYNYNYNNSAPRQACDLLPLRV